MSKLENRLREIEDEIFKSKSLTDKLYKKITSHPLVYEFDEFNLARFGTYHLYFKPLAPWLKQLDIKLSSYATPGWDGQYKDGISIEPELYGNSYEFDYYFPGDGKGSYSFENVKIGSDTVNVREYLEFFLPEKTEKMYDELFLVPVKEKKLESIKNVDDYIDWYYGQIDRIIETLKKSLKLVKEVAIDNPMFNKGGKHAHGGELMDADTKFEYSRGGDFREDGLDKEDLEGVVEVIDDVIRDVEIASDTIDQALPENLKPNYEAYGRYGFDQLLGNGNPYDDSLFTLKDRVQEEADDFPDDYAKGGRLDNDEISQIASLLSEQAQEAINQNWSWIIEEVDEDGKYDDDDDDAIMKKTFQLLGERADYYAHGGKLMDADTEVEYAKGGNLKNHSKLINNWVMFCFNYPANFLDAFNDDLNMKKHLSKKFSTLYNRVGADAVMNLFWTQLSRKNQSKLLNWVDKNYKG